MSADLSALLRAAGRAHHHAFAHVNGEDFAWPAWYAEWLAPRLGSTLRTMPTVDRLADDLREIEDERLTRAPAAGWPEYCVERLVARYG